LYESNIPPLLRFFHIRDISPSGWIAIPKKKITENNDYNNINCDFSFETNYKNIIPLNDKETRVPYKIMSFDIEASSSHGDFPVPIKTYKKLATNIIEYFESLKMEMTKDLCKNILRRIILSAFGYEKMNQVDIVYPKKHPGTKEEVQRLCEIWLETQVRNLKSEDNNDINKIENMFEKMEIDDEEECKTHIKQSYKDIKATGWYRYLEYFWARHYEILPLSQKTVRGSNMSKRPLSWSTRQSTTKEESLVLN
jgi:hypothetical protein